MNIKRSYFKLLIASGAVALFLANCTFKESDGEGDGSGGDPGAEACTKGDKHSGCACPGALVGYQVCTSEGVYGSCVCPDVSGTGGTNNAGGVPSAGNGGITSTAGAGAGGAPPVTAGAGAGGEGGADVVTFVPEDPNDCEACLKVLCKTEYDTCVADETNVPSCVDQYAAIIGCIDDERENGLVKRDVVRACGVSVGANTTGSLNDAWAPADMLPATTDLINCLATATSDPKGPNPDWANDIPNNFPAAGPTPWPADSCAKLACTARFQ